MTMPIVFKLGGTYRTGQFDMAHSFGGRITQTVTRWGTGKKHINHVLITGGAGMKPRRSASFYVKKYVAKGLKHPSTYFLSPQI